MDGASSDQLLVRSDADMVRGYPRFEQRDEHETVSADHAHLDRSKGRLLGRRVEVHRLERADLRACWIHDVVPTPVSDVLCFEQCALPRLTTLAGIPGTPPA
jgi:hypothetical protein